jgi:hypothetical protein
METKEKLDLLSSYQLEIQEIAIEKQKLIDSVMTDEIKQKLADIEAEFLGKMAAANAKITDLDMEIRQDILANGSSVKGNFLMAIWNKGRVFWDAKGLEGFAVAYPQINAFRREGEPLVTIRKI